MIEYTNVVKSTNEIIKTITKKILLIILFSICTFYLIFNTCVFYNKLFNLNKEIIHIIGLSSICIILAIFLNDFLGKFKNHCR